MTLFVNMSYRYKFLPKFQIVYKFNLKKYIYLFVPRIGVAMISIFSQCMVQNSIVLDNDVKLGFERYYYYNSIGF